jgi:multidrug efflux pump subunit AcrA (membrane-fusion protein)
MPLWRTLGNLTAPFRGKSFAKATVIAAISTLLVAGLFCCPYPFALAAKGQLTPEFQHEVFAQVDGIFQEILVADGDSLVKKNQLLARMIEIQNLEGRLSQTKEQIKKLQRARYNQLDTLDDIMLDGELMKSIEAEKSLLRELEIKRTQAASLDIHSPADGQVVNWQVRQNLLRRPVVKGQNLMTIVDPNTQWQLELELPERRVAHLMRACRESRTPLTVSFALVSHPGHEFTGQLVSVDKRLDVYSDDGNAALVRVDFDNSQVSRELLKSGTRVTAKLQCGARSLGYVVFHELIETAKTRLLFWI